MKIEQTVISISTPQPTVRDIRKSLNLTQVEFAKKLGYERAYLAKIETGKIPLNKKFLERLRPYSNLSRNKVIFNIIGID